MCLSDVQGRAVTRWLVAGGIPRCPSTHRPSWRATPSVGFSRSGGVLPPPDQRPSGCTRPRHCAAPRAFVPAAAANLGAYEPAVGPAPVASKPVYEVSVPKGRVIVHTGTMSSRRTATCIALLMGLVLIGAGSGALACTPGASMSVNPRTGAAETTATVKGTSFIEGDVEIRWHTMTGLVLGTARGPSFSTSVTIPNVEPGVYYVLAIARDATGELRGKSSSPFEVTATTTTTTSTTTAPDTQPQQPGSASEGGASQSNDPSSTSGAPSSVSPQSSNDAAAPAPSPRFPSPPRSASEPAVAALAPGPRPAAGESSSNGSPAAAPAPLPPDPPGWSGVATVLGENQSDVSSALSLPALETTRAPTQPVRATTTSAWQWGFIPLTVLVVVVWLDVRRRDRGRREFS